MQESSWDLDQIPANRRLVEELYAYGKITAEARAFALDILHPADQWGRWVSLALLAVGASLVLCGIVFFFAFNWSKITPFIKLSSIQGGMLLSLLGLSEKAPKSGNYFILSF